MNYGYNYFPERLFSMIVKMTNIKSLTFFGTGGYKEIFYTIKDGNWSDMNIWETVSGRLGKSPGINDDVYIRSNVAFDINGLTGVSINNLFISGVLSFAGTGTERLSVLGNGVCSNTLNLNANGGSSLFALYGNNNSILNLYQTAPLQHFMYAGTQPQKIIDIVYASTLELSGGEKSTLNVLNVGGLLSKVVLYINFDFICNGNCDMSGNLLSFVYVKYACKSILIVGNLSIGSCVFDNSFVNANIELQGGITGFVGTFKSGTGTLSFTTNNQSITNGGTLNIDAVVLISGAITVINSITVAPNLILNNTLNGDNASSTFDNRSVVQYKNSTRPMVVGILQCNNAANTFKYNLSGNQDVTGGTYFTIEFGGSGVKTLQGNVIVNVTGGGGQSTTGSASVNLNGFTITTI